MSMARQHYYDDEHYLSGEGYADAWIVEIDGDVYVRPSEADARALAAQLESHPSATDRRLFGPWANCNGTAHVRQTWACEVRS